MPKSEMTQTEPLSKTQKKQAMHDLQKLGKTLIDLTPTQLAEIPLPEVLRDAIHLAHQITSNGATKRHLQYIGKLMREIDIEPVLKALKVVQMHHQQRVTQFHKIETWRDDLLQGDEEKMQELLTAYPNADRQKLRQLVRKAKKDGDQTGAETELFRYLRELLG